VRVAMLRERAGSRGTMAGHCSGVAGGRALQSGSGGESQHSAKMQAQECVEASWLSSGCVVLER
jgi:hypothetical protein